MESGKKDLNYISDDDLERQLKSLSRLVKNSRFSEQKRIYLETEFCYLQREYFIRQTRISAHEIYLQNRKNIGSNRR